MISVNEAKKIIQQNTRLKSAGMIPIDRAAGLMLADSILSPMHSPPFAQSSMDGYAFCFADWKDKKAFTASVIIEAGNNASITLQPGQAARIFTGAKVPQGADTVVMQEKTRLENGLLIIEDEMLQPGDNVRPCGSDVTQGSIVLEKNSLLTPPAIALLAGLGITEVMVIDTPRVALVITGNELQKPGSLLQSGQVYESTSYGLLAALQMSTRHVPRVLHSSDQLDELTSILQLALADSDVVLLTGGVSVGDFDFVVRAAEKCGVAQLFHKVKQRPGKPLFFGKRDEKLVFGLPGNPSSALTCYYAYVLEAFECLTGIPMHMKTCHAPLKNRYTKKNLLTHFLKAFFDGHAVAILDGQESYKLNSFARANCLVVTDEQPKEYPEGSMMEIHLLPA